MIICYFFFQVGFSIPICKPQDIQNAARLMRSSNDSEFSSFLENIQNSFLSGFVNCVIYKKIAFEKEMLPYAHATLLHLFLSFFEDNDFLEALISHSEYLDFLPKKGYFSGLSVLYFAVLLKKNRAVRAIIKKLKQDQVLYKVDSSGMTALMWGCYHNHVDFVKLLVKRVDSTYLNAQESTKGFSAFMFAVQQQANTLIQYLLSIKNMDPNIKNFDQGTALMIAAQVGNDFAIKVLLKDKRINCLDKSNSGMNALMYASLYGHLKSVRLFVNFMIWNINHQDNYGFTTLILAIQEGHSAIAKMLLSYDADITIVTYDGYSPLMYAAQNGHLDIIVQLLSQIKRPGNKDKKYFNYLNYQAKDGVTALMLAAAHGHLRVVKYLANQGANVYIKNGMGEDAFSFASRNNARSVMKYLLAYFVPLKL